MNLPGYDTWSLRGPRPVGKYLGACGTCCNDFYGARDEDTPRCLTCNQPTCPDCMDLETGQCRNCLEAGRE